jgi:hypothetical protein
VPRSTEKPSTEKPSNENPFAGVDINRRRTARPGLCRFRALPFKVLPFKTFLFGTLLFKTSALASRLCGRPVCRFLLTVTYP